MKLKESDDMRAPLAFLLGKLDFDKEFRNLQAQPEGADTRITAEPKTDNLPYSRWSSWSRPDQHIGGEGDRLRPVDHWSSPSTRKRWTRHGCQAVSVSDAQGREAGGERAVAMAEFVLKYADGRGEIHHQVATAASEKELRERYSQQGFLIYSIKPRSGGRRQRPSSADEEAQPGEVPDLQPAVRHADPRRACRS